MLVVSLQLIGNGLPTKLVPFWSFYARDVIINPSPLAGNMSAFHLTFQLSTLGVKLSGKLERWQELELEGRGSRDGDGV